MNYLKLDLPAKKVSNRMPCEIPNTVIMCIGNFNLGVFMPVHQNNFNSHNKELFKITFKLQQGMT